MAQMKLSIKSLGAIVIVLTSLVGCSNQYRNADLGMSGADVIDQLTQLESEYSTSGTGGSQGQLFFNLKNDENSSIYYADAPYKWPVASVFSVVRYDFVDPSISGLFVEDIEEARLAFILSGDRSQCALMIDLKIALTGQYLTRYFQCDSVEVDGGEFVAVLSGDSGSTIALRSFDTDDNGDLNGVVQFRVSDFDSFGEERANGKFSIMVGFGP